MLKHENFVYWLQGFFEISGATTLNEEQVKVIKEHIELCFLKVSVPTQSYSLGMSGLGVSSSVPGITDPILGSSGQTVVTLC